MSEVSFAKQFLASLDSKPTKLSSDYVADPRKLPKQPAFILPRTSKPYPKATGAGKPDPGASTAAQLNVNLSSLRKTSDSPAPVRIKVDARISIYDLKTHLGAQTGYPPDKLKILWERKPQTDSKTLKEVVGREDGDVDMAVMYTGAPQPLSNKSAAVDGGVAGTSTPGKMDVDETPVAQGPSGELVLETTGFWKDLEDFVVQRVRDEAVGKEAVGLWKRAWSSR